MNLDGDQAFDRLNLILMKMTKLKHIKLVGTGISSNLGELAEAFRRPTIESINIQYNGIIKEYLTVNFKHIFNFENLVELDFSNNWFGIDGLYEVKDQFIRFEKLKVLKLGTDKLCFGEPEDTVGATKLTELLLNFPKLEELDL